MDKGQGNDSHSTNEVLWAGRKKKKNTRKMETKRLTKNKRKTKKTNKRRKRQDESTKQE